MPARSIFSGPGITFTMSCTVRVTTDVAGAGELSFFFSAVRLAGARLALVVAAGAGLVVPVARTAVRRAEEPLEDLCFLDELRRFLLEPVLVRCLTGVVATGVVLTGAAGAGVGVAAVVVTVAAEPELLPLYAFFFLLSLVGVDTRFFEPLVGGGLGAGVGAATVVTPLESV